MTSNRSVSEMVERLAREVVMRSPPAPYPYNLYIPVTDAVRTALDALSSQAQSDDVVERVAREIRGLFIAFLRGLETGLPGVWTRDNSDNAEEGFYHAIVETLTAATPPAGEFVERIHAALTWIGPLFIDEETPADELRRRISFCRADAESALATLNESSAIGGGDGR